jgi:hypothetical protein
MPNKRINCRCDQFLRKTKGAVARTTTPLLALAVVLHEINSLVR